MEPSLQPPGRISCPRLTSLQWVLLKFLFPCLAMFFSRHGEAELRQITLTMTPIPLELRYQRRLVYHIFIDIFLESPSNITWNWFAKRGEGVTPLRTNSAKYYLTSLNNCIFGISLSLGSSAVGLLLSICICIGVYIYLQACPLHKQGLYGNGHFWTFLTGWGSHELFTSGGPSFGSGSAPPSLDRQVESYLCFLS